MIRYDSVGHWLDTRDWSFGGSRSTARDVHGVESIVVRPITETRPDGTAEYDDTIYTVRTFSVDPRNVKRFVDLSENQWCHGSGKVKACDRSVNGRLCLHHSNGS